VAAALAAARSGFAERLSELCDWLAIPSVSADPSCRGAMTRAAVWLKDWLRTRGAEVWLLPTGSNRDVVVGRFAGAAGAPLVLVYGHYDVQPPGRGWTTEPFRPVVIDGRLRGRGTTDDKGQLFAHLAAIDAWLRVGGLPVSVVIVAEGAEEIGSLGFARAAAWVARRWRPDVILVSDTERAADAVPSLTVSQRGTVRARLQVDVGGGPVHPGRLGGAVCDPSLLLSATILRLHESLARLVGQDPPSLREMVIRSRSDQQIQRAAGGRLVEAGQLDRRVTRGTTMSVLRLRSADSARAKVSSAIPSSAQAELDVRFPPSISDRVVMQKMYQVLNRGAQVSGACRLSFLSSTPGLVALPPTLVRQAVDRACRRGFGHPAVYLRSGGTIPAVGALFALFGVSPLLLGLGSPGSRAHGPDEFLDLEGWHRAVHTSIALLAGLAKTRNLETA
jgi:acetylornithine deacetylase/succinyl-diaminopimelate desuccinylase-like protein